MGAGKERRTAKAILGYIWLKNWGSRSSKHSASLLLRTLCYSLKYLINGLMPRLSLTFANLSAFSRDKEFAKFSLKKILSMNWMLELTIGFFKKKTLKIKQYSASHITPFLHPSVELWIPLRREDLSSLHKSTLFGQIRLWAIDLTKWWPKGLISGNHNGGIELPI